MAAALLLHDEFIWVEIRLFTNRTIGWGFIPSNNICGCQHSHCSWRRELLRDRQIWEARGRCGAMSTTYKHLYMVLLL